MISPKRLGAALLALAMTANAFCPFTNDDVVCVEAIVPSSGNDLYLQISASDRSGWAGIGIGQSMAGALIFVIYPNAANDNLTLSPRVATGHEEPVYDSSINVDILNGTGIKDGRWTMNFVCHNCRDKQSIDVTSTEQPFIAAYGGGHRVNYNTPDYTGLYQHSDQITYKLNLAAVTTEVKANVNPFTNSTLQTGGSASKVWTKADRTLLAHGVIMAVCWLFLLPLGASFIRFLGQAFPRPVPLYLHAGMQTLTFSIAIIGFSMGIYTSELYNTHFYDSHQKLGVAIITLFLIQVPMGYMHHVNFVATGKRGFWSYAHIWNGRIVISLGIVNGGMGLDLAGIKTSPTGPGLVEKKWVIAYATVAGIVSFLYISGLIYKSLLSRSSEKNRGKQWGEGSGYEMRSEHGSL